MHSLTHQLVALDQWFDRQPVRFQILFYLALTLFATAPINPVFKQIQEWLTPPVIEIQCNGNPDHLA